MNIGSFLHRGQKLYGVFKDETVTTASDALRAIYPTLRDLLEADHNCDALKNAGNLAASLPVADIVFQTPIPNAHKIICVGMNYPKPYPVDGVAPPNPENIILFGKEREALVGHERPLESPQGQPADSFDYEGEIAAIIGKPARHVTPEQAMEHVLGYAPFNDGSVRDWQRHSIYAGKNFANSGSWGPWITTVDALPQIADLHLTVTLNGEVMQSAFGREMIFTLPQQIAYASSLFTLHPGDVIATGSPDGTGGSRTPKRFLKPKDIVSITVQGIGTLSNTVSSSA
ncbi:MAG: fumarylacetoacetate hydrolase family protein [Marivita sp.]|uniref:fumarylacetoacetate hydrolase family protein n=1 Tax=Marivita sp. TaxID=2003365 RepID=UPI001B2A923F|nr:fumarylacetoacetate hydrolase family protein [Marivita sp.]MBO6884097.1 fumarylacetoacetate hydrolase family protein [Marivita sp.]